MQEVNNLIERIIDRININLRKPAFDVRPYIRHLIPPSQLCKFYAFYGLTPNDKFHLRLSHSSLAGSYFLGKCIVDYSLLYKTDIRGDELKRKGTVFRHGDISIPLHHDEVIRVRDSYLIKTLVHCFSHDPENLEEFLIQNTASMHYANIHGSPVRGCFLGPFCTVDLTTLYDSVIGTFAYVQVGELNHEFVDPGLIWIRSEGHFDFKYRFDADVLRRYIELKEPGEKPRGILFDFVESYKEEFQKAFDIVQFESPVELPTGASLSPYTARKGKIHIGENVLVAQRAYLSDAWLGKGSNAQENCYIIDSRLDGSNVTAHGGKIVHSDLGEKVFVGFNAFLRGQKDCRLTVGKGTIVMPHSIIDLQEPLNIPADHIVWGYINNRDDLKSHSISFSDLASVNGELKVGSMHFQGDGAHFVEGFQHRIEHILETNGAKFNGTFETQGHAQNSLDIFFNTIQPYAKGALQGLYPTIEVRP
jgi:carbonic anhydrase/acetyltransferase-like protein (isoleucine patch superfamily)